jgi:hypothetical protein
MPEMRYNKANDTCEFGCYGERGLVSYFMFVVLPTQIGDFLAELRFPAGVANPFIDLRGTNPKATIFSELDLGKKHGFGCPDGAIYLECPEPTMIFIEVKMSKSYAESNRIKPQLNRNDGYNSTLKGQFELKWRLTELNRRRSHVDSSTETELRETDSMYHQYKDSDWFYKRRAASGITSHRRHLNIDSGVKKFLDRLRDTGDRVYFLAITSEQGQNSNSSPFTSDARGMPRTCDTEWDVAKAQFCWLPIHWLKWESSHV